MSFQAMLHAICVELMIVGHGQELSPIVFFLGFSLELSLGFFLALTLDFQGFHFAGLGEDKHSQQDDEDRFVHS